jgi:serine/threonine protein kinase
MAPSSPFFCIACGTANQTQATLCWACGQPLATSIEDTVLTSGDTVPASPLSVASPTLLAGRYHIIDTVGKDGFGAVYKAEDVQRIDSLVAIKSINLSGLSPRQKIEATDTLNREARLLSDLTHPNLPRVYEHFTDGENWYLTMDFIEGETLEESLNRTKDGYLPMEEVLEIGVQLCDVLNYLHTRQPPIIFHDVKPANIMRTPGGQLYLINFGIAHHFTLGQAGDTNAPGTPDYAAPEQYSRAQTTVQSDIYSLGATLRYLLTGKDLSEPTFGNTAPDVQDQQAPTLLEHFFMQMLEVDADKRPESMKVVKPYRFR